MGGAVVSLMEWRSNSSRVPNVQYAARIAYGAQNIRISEDQAGESGVYRRDKLTAEEHAYFMRQWVKEPNLMQILEANCVERSGRNALAYRKVDHISKEKTVVTNDQGKSSNKVFEYVHLCDPTHITYGQLWEKLTGFGRGLATLNEQRGGGYGATDKAIRRIAMYEETRWEWLVTMLGIWSQEMVAVTVYANLGVDALVYALKEAECGAIVLNGNAVKRLLELCHANNITDAVFIYLDDLPEGGDAAALDTRGNTVISWEAVLQLGRDKAAEVAEREKKAQMEEQDRAFLARYAVKIPTDPDTVVLVMYTSGTTGNPKGVIHSIGALTQGSKGLQTMLSELIGTEAENETYVCYLPAAHIFEFICEMIFLSRGILLCFGSPRTLTDVFARPCGDITCFKPFFLIGVPRIYETLKKTVESKLPPVGSLKRNIFERAYASRLQALKDGKDTPFWNEKVFAAARHLMGGGTMRGVCSGGAPLADKTQEWINVVLGVPVAQGYGMTETVCNATVQRTGELVCMAGQLLRGVEAKLLDTEDYKHTDKPNPRGELCLRGSFMFKGYYNQPELTKEVLSDDGWIRTGDVAEVALSEGNEFKIIGRVKALAKNVFGEYIALESLEALYSTHPVVIPNGIVVLVDTQRPYISGICLTDERKAMGFAAEKKIPGEWPAILETAAFNDAVAKDMAALGSREGLQRFELLRKVRVLHEDWTPENGLVTASLKVRRTKIDEHYKDTIKELFVES